MNFKKQKQKKADPEFAIFFKKMAKKKKFYFQKMQYFIWRLLFPQHPCFSFSLFVCKCYLSNFFLFFHTFYLGFQSNLNNEILH